MQGFRQGEAQCFELLIVQRQNVVFWQEQAADVDAESFGDLPQIPQIYVAFASFEAADLGCGATYPLAKL